VSAVVIISGGLLLRKWQRVPPARTRVAILRVPIDPLTMEHALERIDAFIRSGQPHHVFTADASGIMRAHEDPALLEMVRQADLITPDGSGVMLASRMRGVALPERVSGVDLVQRISERSAQRGYRLYFFGAAVGVAQAAADALQIRYPGMTVAGTRNGYFTPDDEANIVAEIAAAKPDVLFVALGIPKQELFIRRYFQQLGVPVMVGIGGSLDVISGKLQRAPSWMQRAGLEWLYRVLQEPTRYKRLTALPHFVVAAWRGRHDA
jgi:N-acetylglucosaminyldiphosphoundecaprenol N-acetyl-beta-D-mannosaminyltransferase